MQKSKNNSFSILFICSCFFAVAFMMGCASPTVNVKTPVQTTTAAAPLPSFNSVPSLDSTANKMYVGFKSGCFEPILKREYPEKECSKRLFDSVERQYGSRWNDVQLKKVASQQFFDALESVLSSKIAKNKNLQAEVQQKYKSPEELYGYYKKRFLF